ncbi:putative 3,4-dihydroxy-2-butanone kinase [Vitis vinifera]|uniref:Putative 3,4-dihydroxy-2-butanone kinase n=1 Tax=Vitis vinifera TaxID=29760 RepID=A0A438GQR1_VITVI|nr:putative 3,4-dihydroxy-2-butanone kinase [Vitis vinifera]
MEILVLKETLVEACDCWKFGEEGGGWTSGVLREGYGVGFRKTIRKNWEVFKPGFASLLGMGGESNMWEDEGELVHWSPYFSRQFYDWELEMVEDFLRRIQKHAIWCEIEDRMTWSASRNMKFSVKAFYSFLSLGDVEAFPIRVIGKPWVPTRFEFLHGSYHGKNHDFRLLENKGDFFVGDAFFGKKCENLLGCWEDTTAFGTGFTVLPPYANEAFTSYTKSLGEGVTVKSEILALLEGLLLHYFSSTEANMKNCLRWFEHLQWRSMDVLFWRKALNLPRNLQMEAGSWALKEVFLCMVSLSRPQLLNEQGCILEVAIEAAANSVINLKDWLNEWDSKAGDGDCGSTMFRGATAILEDMKKFYPLNDPAETVNEIGSSIRRAMGGTSGIIYDIFCKAAYAQLKANTKTVVTAKQWKDALEASIAAVSKYGGASAGYRTMLDALIPALTVLQERLDAEDDPVTAFVLSSEAALAGAESTKHMQAQPEVASSQGNIRCCEHVAAPGRR